MILPMHYSSIRFKLFIIFTVFFSGHLVHAKSDAEQKTITFGQSAALSGPAKYLGTNMRIGILAAFEEINHIGGVQGHRLKLTSMDDMYEPEKAIKNTRLLVEKENIFALIGAVGTPTSKAVLPLVSELSVPYIGPFTGAEFLRTTKSPVINIRASYYQEAEVIVERLLQDLKTQRISVLYQDDSYGRAGLKGLTLALKKKNKKIVSQGKYSRNTTAVKVALLEIMSRNPEAVVIVGTYLPVAKFVKLAESINFNPVFICLSFVGTSALQEQLKKEGGSKNPIVVTQVVPFPFDTDHPLVVSYQKAVKKDFNFVSLEGYLIGRFTIEVLKRMQPPFKPERFMNAVKKIKKVSIDKFTLEYGPKDNQGSNQVFFTLIKDGKLFSVFNLREVL